MPKNGGISLTSYDSAKLANKEKRPSVLERLEQFKARMKKGMRCSGSIPYGYKRTKEDKQQLLVDEPAAEVVRKI